MLGNAHVVAATTALVLAVLVLWLAKGTSRHRALGLAYVCALTTGNFAALLVRQQSGAVGPFHLLAVVSLLTITGGLATAPRRRHGSVTAHARFMLWSVLGLTAAGLAQLTNAALPGQKPWPVLLVTLASIATGVLAVPPSVDRGSGVRR